MFGTSKRPPAASSGADPPVQSWVCSWRAGIPVLLLEAHKDFDRDFRGDTIHASVMEIMHQLGLAERVLELAHARLDKVKVYTAETTFVLEDLSRLKSRFPFATMIPQARFIEFIVSEAKKFPQFKMIMGANVQRLVEQDRAVRGVRYQGADQVWHEVRAPVDGRRRWPLLQKCAPGRL